MGGTTRSPGEKNPADAPPAVRMASCYSYYRGAMREQEEEQEEGARDGRLQRCGAGGDGHADGTPAAKTATAAAEDATEAVLEEEEGKKNEAAVEVEEEEEKEKEDGGGEEDEEEEEEEGGGQGERTEDEEEDGDGYRGSMGTLFGSLHSKELGSVLLFLSSRELLSWREVSKVAPPVINSTY